MIALKTSREADKMRAAGKIAAGARKLAGELIRPGITTKQIDRELRAFIKAHGAIPSSLNYNGFPAGVCTSVNDEVIHGIPGPRKLKEGDIVDVDVAAYLDGWHADCCSTFCVGECDSEAKRLVQVCRDSFFAALEFAQRGCRVGDIGRAVQQYVEERGFSIVKDYVGHGIGREYHEDPEVPNYEDPKRRGVRLLPGMVIAIEPMINQGTAETYILGDGWTVVTRDGKFSAHYENTVLITDGLPEILTPVGGDGFA